MNVPEFVYGNIAPVFTMFKDDLSLDPDGQRRFLDWLLQTDAISAYFVRSGLGQMFTYGVEDTKQMAKTACNHLADKAPVLVGCNGVWDRNRKRLPDPDLFQRQAIELSRYAQDVGASGVVHTIPDMLTPQAGKTPVDVTLQHFERIAASVTIPVFIYQPPGTANEYMLTPEAIRRLASIPNVVAAKISTNNAYYLFRLIRAAQSETFSMIAGAETIFYAALYAGAPAVIGQGCTINPQIIKALQQRFEAGDQAGVIEAQHSVNMLCEECRNPVDFLKRYVSEQGFPVGRAYRSAPDNLYVAYPEPMSDEEYQRFKLLFEQELAQYVS